MGSLGGSTGFGGGVSVTGFAAASAFGAGAGVTTGVDEVTGCTGMTGASGSAAGAPPSEPAAGSVGGDAAGVEDSMAAGAATPASVVWLEATDAAERTMSRMRRDGTNSPERRRRRAT